MAIGDILVSDNRHLEIAADADSPTYSVVDKALLSCNARILFEIISYEYAFGEKGKKSAVSSHYTWKVDTRLRIDLVLAKIIRGALPAPLGASGTRGKFLLKFAEEGATASADNPVMSGASTVADISSLIADNDAPATERVINITFQGSGDLDSTIS